jgi:hypothetical protein
MTLNSMDNPVTDGFSPALLSGERPSGGDDIPYTD